MRRGEITVSNVEIITRRVELTIGHFIYREIITGPKQITIRHDRATMRRGRITIRHGEVAICRGEIAVPRGEICTCSHSPEKPVACPSCSVPPVWALCVILCDIWPCCNGPRLFIYVWATLQIFYFPDGNMDVPFPEVLLLCFAMYQLLVIYWRRLSVFVIAMFCDEQVIQCPAFESSHRNSFIDRISIDSTHGHKIVK